MTMTVALGTSTPTSMTDVAISMSASPRLNCAIAASLSSAFILPWQTVMRYSGSGKSRDMDSKPS